jgi:hypothetical protein
MNYKFEDFKNHNILISDIIPFDKHNNIEINKYIKYFDENKLSPAPYFGNRTIFNNSFDIIQTYINKDQVYIINPNNKIVYESDFYFLITYIYGGNTLGPDLYCCYYFKGSNQILLFNLGAGFGSMGTQNYCLIDFLRKNIYTKGIHLEMNLFENIIIKKKEIDNLEDYEKFLRTIPKENITFYGGYNNVGHHIFNDYSGVYLLEQTNVFKKTNKFIIGKHNACCFNEYFKKNYPSSEIINCDDFNLYNNFNGRGIAYKYNHHFVSNNMRSYIYNNFKNNNLISVNNYTTEILNKLDINCYKLLIILRCGSRDMIDQENKLVEFIKLFKNEYPQSIIILGGFTTNNKSYNKLSVGYFNQTYKDIHEHYNEVSNNIINKCGFTNDIYNINNSNFKETLLISKKCNIAIYQHGSGSTICAWLCNIPGICVGFHDMGRYIWMDKYINEDNKNLYLTDTNIIKYNVKEDHVYTFELNIPLFYDYFKSLLKNITI